MRSLQLQKDMKEKFLSSRQNPIFKDLVDLLSTKGIKDQGRFLIFGSKVISEVLKTQPKLCETLIVPEHSGTQIETLPLITLSGELFNDLDVFGTRSPLLVCRTPQMKTWETKNPVSGLELFCALGEPSNVGALIRSAAAFEVSKIVFLKESASPFHPKSVRAAAGTMFDCEFARGPSIKDLEAKHFVCLDMKGENLSQFQWPKNVRLLVGQEGRGVPKDFKAKRLSIPMNPKVESLNATVAASLALYGYRTFYS